MAAPKPDDILLLTNADGKVLEEMRKAIRSPKRLNRRPGREPQSSDDYIYIRITGHTPDGSNKRWKYDWVEVRKTAAGYGGWTTVTGGLSGHGSDFDYAYNTIENLNGATGTFGNGVLSTDLTGTLDIQPVVTGNIFRAWLVYPDALNANNYPCQPEIWFSSENGVTGGCP